MIQRVQTLYLIFAGIISLGLIFVFSLWTNTQGVEIFALSLFNEGLIFLKVIPILFVLSGFLSLMSIFLFKNRKNQFVLNRINILINLILLGVLIYHLLMLSGETQVSEKGIGVFLPVVVIVLLAIANKAIKKDEDLVKSVDRLR
ncbi:MAG: DUF4293 domain-containing protein [Flavobacteriaceae bacterium]|nr:DUF4293 domain-containing protein [Flavobacteriaceae bacterium]